jgi:cytoskeleton protein RodZ
MSKRKKPKPMMSASLPEVAPTLESVPSGQLDLAIGQDIEQSSLQVSYVADEATSGDVSAAQESVMDAAPPAQAVVAETESVTSELPVSDSRFESTLLDAVAPAREETRQSLGERFRSIRESRGISREEMARRLRVSPSVVQDIESDQWQRLGAPVYVRGHLNSYAKTLEVPAVVVSMALRDLDEPAPLALTVAAPVAASWWSRYSRNATYVVLTLLLAIPIFTILDYRGVTSSVPRTQQVRSMEDNEAGLADSGPRQLLPTAAVTPEFVGPPESAAGVAAQEWTAPTVNNPPLMASMTPIGSSLQESQLSPGMHRIEMRITEDTWLEIVDAAGTRLDYGIARAGERRAHEVDGTVAMSIGNVSGVELVVDGKAVDLLPFARLNVARLKLFEPEPTSVVPSR